ncbi:DUF6517 family protein [Halorussus halobius]|uniref:DUF6517 family protein n=1 Tax=Halorussus halobius TaxID=1710537 RepID=UPI0010926D7A|nr:DUF6517 family protein [Halorussus halobius]
MNRTLAASSLLALFVVTAGCTGVLSGPITVSASEASVDDAALGDTGYEHNRTEAMNVSRTVSVAGQSRNVTATNWIAEYHASVGIEGVAEQPVAAFVVFSSPKVEVLGQSFNPLDEFSDRHLAETFVSRMDRVENVRQVDSRNRTMLGQSAEVSEFEASVTTAIGIQFDATLHVTRVEHEGDFVVALAVHPQQIDGESDVNRLLDGVEHGE